MNAKDTAVQKKQTWNSFHLPGGSNLNRIKKNAIFVSAANSKDGYLHEFCKAAVCVTLKKLGKEFITEAVGNRCNLRHDVVCLDSGNIYEVETERSRALRFQNIECPCIVILVDGLGLQAAIELTVKTVEANE